MNSTSNIVYLDNNSTTQLDPRVLEEMLPYFTEVYSNASSSHAFGSKANQAVKQAREAISNAIGANPNEIIFTSGSTEAINLAIKGIVENSSKGNHIITVQTEHKAVLDVCAYLEQRGYDTTYLSVNKEGLIDLQELKDAIREDTCLISVMPVNNETGVIQDIKQIGAVAKERGIVMMTDATQAVGKMPIDVDELNVDLLAFSAHKFYGPKGIGVVYVRNKTNPVALIHGGGHEKGFRSGTLNVPGIIGMSKALSIAIEELETTIPAITELRNTLQTELLTIEGAFVNGSLENRLYNVINIHIPQIEASVFIGRNKDIAVSNGSACTSFVIKPSHVLQAMGLSNEEAFSSLRFSFGKFNTMADIEIVIDRIRKYSQ